MRQCIENEGKSIDHLLNRTQAIFLARQAMQIQLPPRVVISRKIVVADVRRIFSIYGIIIKNANGLDSSSDLRYLSRSYSIAIRDFERFKAKELFESDWNSANFISPIMIGKKTVGRHQLHRLSHGSMRLREQSFGSSSHNLLWYFCHF
jgi:hypothetical protein